MLMYLTVAIINAVIFVPIDKGTVAATAGAVIVDAIVIVFEDAATLYSM